MATKLFGQEFPDWLGTLGASACSLFQIMTLESWSMGIVRPVMDAFPYAWAFFVPFIVVNAMQTEQEKVATEDRTAERDMTRDETAPLFDEIKALRIEIARLQQLIELNHSDKVSGSQRMDVGL